MFRKGIQKLHLWLSLLAGVFIVLVGLTGSILVFEGEITRLTSPELFQVTPGKVVPLEQALEAVTAGHEKRTIDRIYGPDYRDAYGVYYFRAKDGKETKYIYVDPGTGKVLGERGSESFFNWVLQLHRYLLLKDFNGAEIVATIGFVITFITVSGIYLWWPGLAKWTKGFVIRNSKNRYALHYDYHKVFGIISVPFLLVVSLTGALFVFDEPIFAMFGAKPNKSPAKELLVSQPLDSGKLPIDQLIAVAQKSVPDGKFMQIRMPAKPEEGKPEGTVDIRMSHGYDPSGAGNVQLWLDQYSGKIIAKQDAVTDAGLTYQTWLFPLHTGLFGGIFTKILYFIGGLMPALLMVTGTYMWYTKRARQRLAKRMKTEKHVQSKVAETA